MATLTLEKAGWMWSYEQARRGIQQREEGRPKNGLRDVDNISWAIGECFFILIFFLSCYEKPPWNHHDSNHAITATNITQWNQIPATMCQPNLNIDTNIRSQQKKATASSSTSSNTAMTISTCSTPVKISSELSKGNWDEPIILAYIEVPWYN